MACVKEAFPTPQAAWRRVRFVLSRRGSRRHKRFNGHELEPYQCRDCKQWHIGNSYERQER